MHTHIQQFCRIGLVILFVLTTAVVIAQPQLQVNRNVLNFGANPGSVTNNQTFLVENSGDGTLNWSVNSEEDWLSLHPSSGTGSGLVTVTVDPGSLPSDFYYSEINILNQDDTNDKTGVSGILNVYDAGSSMPSFGSFDTPMDGAAIYGTVPVTGWVLDDIGVESVSIYREDDMMWSHVGNATFVEGARPDVEATYPEYPQSYKAGWGYMLLTNALPGGGNGTYTLRAFAGDKEGNSTDLGTKTITVDNANAVKPFGAIDTPAQGGLAYGTEFKNQGWVLTPQPNTIPLDGSTINVYVDGVNVGHPIYNVYRQDAAGLFSGYTNSNGAGGYYVLDTTPYSNGVHTIQWTAADGNGNTDGIGSRYFTVQNLDMPTPVTNRQTLNYGADLDGNQTGTQSIRISNRGQGTLNWDVMPSNDWIHVDPISGENTGYIDVSVDPTGLDPGSYHGNLQIMDPNAGMTSVNLNLWKSDGSFQKSPSGSMSSPGNSNDVSGAIPVTGWALDENKVESVKIYAGPEGMPPQFIGDANFVEGSRPDIEQSHSHTPMNYKAGWGYMLLTNTLPGGGNGTYTLEAVATNVAGQQSSLGTKTISVDNENAVKPFGAIDSPGWGQPIAGNQARISGWALTPQPNSIPTDGSTIDVYVDGQFMGNPTYNQYRDDIATPFPGYANSQGAGWYLDLDTTPYRDGVHTVQWTVTDVPGGTGSKALDLETVTMAQLFIVQNERPISPPSDVDVSGKAAPDQFTLHPVYPNPFNPNTKISFQMDKPGRVNLTIYDLRGRQVCTLLENLRKDAGSHTLEWFGTNNSGNQVSSGVYFLVLKSEKKVRTQKMVLIR